MEELLDTVFDHINYYVFVALILVGFYAMITRRHLVRKVVGMTIFSTGIILFFVSMGAKWSADIPILTARDTGHAAEHGAPDEHGPPAARPNPSDYANPLPHVLMLTAIVVSVATLGVALGIIIRIEECYGTLDEIELLDALERERQVGA